MNWLPQVLVAGIGEEIVARGALFRMLEEGRGSGWALAVSTLVFGGACLQPPRHAVAFSRNRD